MSERRVDAPLGDLYVGRARFGRVGVLGGFVLVAALAACTGSRPATLAPEPGAERAARDVREETRLKEPIRIVFEWRLNESGSRLGGQGVARMEPSYRARLDLFTDNGETAARAALVDGELRLPPEVDRRLIPPPPLLWTALGVFRPGDEARLVAGEGRTGEELVLRYALPQDRALRYELQGGRVRTAELLREGHVVERVRLEWTEGESFPDLATYRDLAAFRELRVEVESIERADPFPTEIWNPDR